MALIAVCSTVSVIAQPTLTAATNNPVIGDAFTIHYCDTNGISRGASGASVTWNFGSLSQTSTSTETYIACAHPYIDSFPGSTIANTDGAGNYTYFIADVNKFSVTGVYNVATGYQYYTNPATMISYPATYGASHIDTGLIAIPFGSLAVIDSSTNDGYGTLVLPSGTYTNVLRMHAIFHISDNVTWADYQRFEEYRWHVQGFHDPLLAIGYDTTGGHAHISSVEYYTQHTAGISEINGNAMNMEVSPNPATDVVNIKFNLTESAPVTITLCDVVGKVVRNICNTRLSEGAKNLECPVADLSAGVYFIHLANENNNIVKKIVVTK